MLVIIYPVKEKGHVLDSLNANLRDEIDQTIWCKFIPYSIVIIIKNFQFINLQIKVI